MKIKLNNGQSNPYVEVINDKEMVRIYFCKDGGIIQKCNLRHEGFVENVDRSVGCCLGCRPKVEQTHFEEAKEFDGIEIK